MTATFIRRVLAVVPAILLAFAGLANASTTLTFQQGASGYTGAQDTYMWDYNGLPADNMNFDGLPNLGVYEREPSLDNFERTLIQFNLSSISPTTVIGSATLTLVVEQTAAEVGFGTPNVLNSLYIVNPSDTWTASTATWDYANSSTLQGWVGGPGLVAGSDYGAAVATAETPNDVGDTITFTLTTAGIAAINDWIQHASDNTGFFIRQPDGSLSDDAFYSSDEETVSLRPELTLVTAPEPASLGLLLAGGMMLLRRRRTA